MSTDQAFQDPLRHGSGESQAAKTSLLIDFTKLKLKGMTVRSLRMRELNGDDNDAAAARVVNSGTSFSTNGFMLSRAINEQLIADSIIEVDGQPVITPYLDWRKWNLRTREFVMGAFNKINSSESKEMDSFFQALGLVEKPEGTGNAG